MWRMWNKAENRPCTKKEEAQISAGLGLKKPRAKKGATPKK